MLRFVFLSIVLFLTNFSANASEVSSTNVEKIAVVDVQTILDNALAVVYIRNEVDRLNKNLQNEVVKLENDLKNQEEDLIKQKDILSKDNFEKEVIKFNKNVTKAQKEMQEKKIKLEQAHAKALSRVNQLALKIISKLAKKNKYSLVLPSTQILFADEKLNITNEVLGQMNTTLPKVELDF
jgi:outer membrane protein